MQKHFERYLPFYFLSISSFALFIARDIAFLSLNVPYSAGKPALPVDKALYAVTAYFFLTLPLFLAALLKNIGRAKRARPFVFGVSLTLMLAVAFYFAYKGMHAAFAAHVLIVALCLPPLGVIAWFFAGDNPSWLDDISGVNRMNWMAYVAAVMVAFMVAPAVVALIYPAPELPELTVKLIKSPGDPFATFDKWRFDMVTMLYIAGAAMFAASFVAYRMIFLSASGKGKTEQ
ncbi:MAG: hypothetical protein OEV59_05800 [Deltaproteobacteria bacterium]|nr:hypothetical protein [Deltaproteobacteria bacterium]